MNRLESLLRQRREIMRAAGQLKGIGDRREDAIQVGWVSAIARGDASGASEAMRHWVRYWNRGGVTNHADALSPGVSEWMAGRDDAGQQWLATSAGGWGVVLTPREAAGDYEPTGGPPGRPPRRAPTGAPGKLLQAAGIHPLPDGMAELRSLVGSGRRGRDPRFVKAVVECQDWGAEELARLLCCSRQAINAILREHRGV
jgi:hypothetical protein